MTKIERDWLSLTNEGKKTEIIIKIIKKTKKIKKYTNG